MFKSKLQELCHKNAWTLPKYRQQRDGPEYSPRFSASVFVNGLNFDTLDFFKTSKEAQNGAARFAFLYLTGSSISDIDLNFSPLQKIMLQTYTQKKNISLPTYSCEHEGTSHVSLFKARVIVDGKTFEAAEYYYTVKEAEHAATKVALKSLAPDGIREDELGIYKNLLHELTQKEGWNLPQYSTCTSGEPHMLVFVSTVEVDGKTFPGPQSKTKKEAEMGAAKVAYNCLKESKSPGHPPSTIPLHKDGSSSSSQSSGCEMHLPLKAKMELTGGPMASNAIRVYPNLPNLTIPCGRAVLTESDNNWVAVSLDNTARNK